MPKVYLSESDRMCHRLATWVEGEKKIRKLTDTDLAKDHGISQSAMSRKLRVESFDYKDFVFFVQKFKPDTDTLRYIVGL